jgi:hypothetical protein
MATARTFKMSLESDNTSKYKISVSKFMTAFQPSGVEIEVNNVMSVLEPHAIEIATERP